MSEENIESRLQIDPSVFHVKPHYLLKVVGMSMKDIGILDGDLLAVKKADSARNGQIIVARLGDDVHVAVGDEPAGVARLDRAEPQGRMGRLRRKDVRDVRTLDVLVVQG